MGWVLLPGQHSSQTLLRAHRKITVNTGYLSKERKKEGERGELKEKVEGKGEKLLLCWYPQVKPKILVLKLYTGLTPAYLLPLWCPSSPLDVGIRLTFTPLSIRLSSFLLCPKSPFSFLWSGLVRLIFQILKISCGDDFLITLQIYFLFVCGLHW